MSERDPGQELRARIAGLSEPKRALLELLRQRRSPRGPSRRPGAAALAPASTQQQQLWFLDRLAPGQPTYNVLLALRLTGPLRTAALRRSLDLLAARHEALRTRFVEIDGQPWQVVDPPATAALVETDLRDQAPEAREAAALGLVEEELHSPFDLARGPLFRGRLLRVSPERHLLSLALHHSIADGWTLGLLCDELGQSYADHVAGRAARLAEVPLQYADYAVWQRRLLADGAIDRHLDYWRVQLAGLPALELPADRRRPQLPSHAGEVVRRALDRGLAGRLGELARRCGASTFHVIAAALAGVLARLGGQPDVALGTPTSGRTRPELEAVAGLFANMVVLRLGLPGDPPFLRLVERARDVALAAQEYQDAPFEVVVEHLGGHRDPSRNPLFQVSVQLLDAVTGARPPELAGVGVELLDLTLRRSRFDLSVTVAPSATGLDVVAAYAVDLFDRRRLERLLTHLERVLTAVTRDPSLRLSALPLLSPEECGALLAAGRGPDRDRPALPVHQLVWERARRQPHAAAVAGDGGVLTYAALERRARLLAGRLRSLGVAREELVAVALHRGPDTPVAMLGTLQAGAAYLPLDPDDPPARIAYCMEDAGVRVVVTRSELAGRLPAAGSWRRVDLDQLEGAGPASAHEPAAEEWAGAGTLACALFTSGSTGRPKAALIEHRALVNALAWLVEHCRIVPGARVLQSVPPVFDMSSAEVLATLVGGGTLVPVSKETVLSPGGLEEAIRRGRVTHMITTPTTLGLVDPARLDGVSFLIIGGEVTPASLLNRWVGPGRQWVNLYGPAETTIGCCAHDCEPVVWPAPPPVGRPLPNRRLYVVDRWGQPAPAGVPGEVLVGGTGVARGYLRRPALTAERFCPDPFEADERVYRTGDLGRWDDEGRLWFLGRSDSQIKLRGNRIELAEVEAVIAAHPAVAAAAAAVRPSSTGDARLLAYVVPAPGTRPDPAELRRHAAGQLPAVMVPAAVAVVDRFPLGRTGKLDREALPDVEAVRPDRPRASPRDETERRVAAILAEVLGLDWVGVEDDVFELGGGSLHLSRAAARVAEAFGVAVPLREVYAAPTVAALAASVRRLREAGPDAGDVAGAGSMVEIRGTGSLAPLACLHPVTGSVHAYVRLAGLLRPDRPVHGLQAPGLEPGSSPVEDLTELAARYLRALGSRVPGRPWVLAGWSLGGILAFEMAGQLLRAGLEAPTVILIDAWPPARAGVPGDEEVVRQFVHDAAGVAGIRAPDLEGEPAPGLDRLQDVLAGAGLAPRGLEPDVLRRRLAVFGANLRAVCRYTPGQRLPGRLTLIRARESPDLRSGWSNLAGGVDEEVVPGDHHTMWSEANLPALAAAVQRSLDADPGR